MQVIEAVGYAEALLSSEVLNKQVCTRHRRYKRYCELFLAHPDEKRINIVMDVAIEFDVSIQTIYADIRMMEKEL